VKAMDNPCGTVVPLIRGNAPSVLCRLHLLAQKSMIAFFAPEDIVKTVGLEGLDMGSIGTKAVLGNEERKMEGVLAQLG